MWVGNKRIISNSSHAHTPLGLFGLVKFCCLRGEGRMGWEGWLKNGVRMKHMITVNYIEFSFCGYNIQLLCGDHPKRLVKVNEVRIG